MIDYPIKFAFKIYNCTLIFYICSIQRLQITATSIRTNYQPFQ